MDVHTVQQKTLEDIEFLLSGVNISKKEDAENRSINYQSNSESKPKSSKIAFIDTEEFEPPDDIKAERIVQQVEHLFSDDNIIKDKFLLKHIRRNKEGYVSLKLISSLRKVKALTKDWREVVFSLQRSEKLQMNDEKTKIRRMQPIPACKGTTHSKTVLMLNLPRDNVSPEDVKKLLQGFGAIASITVTTLKFESLPLIFKRSLSLCQSITSPTCAVIQFETHEEASNAIKQSTNIDQPFVIIPLMFQDFRNKKNNSKSVTSPEHFHKSENITGIEHGQSFGDTVSSKMNALANHKTLSPDLKVLKPVEQNCGPKKSRRSRRKPVKNPNFVAVSTEDQSMLSGAYRGDGLGNNLRLQRRQLVGNYGRHLGSSRVIILRQPKGPDGTIGFHAGRARAGLKDAPKISHSV